MIWKILFVIISLIFCFLNIGGISNGFVLSEFSISLSYIFSIFVIAVLGLFYALGWKKKLFSNKFINLLIIFCILFFVFSVVMSVITGLNIMAVQVKSEFGTLDQAFYMSAISRLLVLSLLIYLLIYSPVLSACIIYKKNCETFSGVNKPYWKVFLTYIAVQGLIYLSSCLVMMDYGALVWGDIVCWVFMAAKVLFAIGYAYNLKIGTQIVWKILALPMLASALAVPFICSEAFLSLTGQHILINSYSGVVCEFLINLAVFYALYRYAFKQDVYKIKTEN